MEDNLFLHTAFACMACDGDIAPEEIDLLRQMANKGLFGDIDIDDLFNQLVEEINKQGLDFMKKYLNTLKQAQYNKEEELTILKIARLTILADKKVEYSEIKFFKAIRACLMISDKEILAYLTDIDPMWLEDDIKYNSPDKAFDSYINIAKIPIFNKSATSKAK